MNMILYVSFFIVLLNFSVCEKNEKDFKFVNNGIQKTDSKNYKLRKHENDKLNIKENNIYDKIGKKFIEDNKHAVEENMKFSNEDRISLETKEYKGSMNEEFRPNSNLNIRNGSKIKGNILENKEHSDIQNNNKNEIVKQEGKGGDANIIPERLQLGWWTNPITWFKNSISDNQGESGDQQQKSESIFDYFPFSYTRMQTDDSESKQGNQTDPKNSGVSEQTQTSQEQEELKRNSGQENGTSQATTSDTTGADQRTKETDSQSQLESPDTPKIDQQPTEDEAEKKKAEEAEAEAARKEEEAKAEAARREEEAREAARKEAEAEAAREASEAEAARKAEEARKAAEAEEARKVAEAEEAKKAEAARKAEEVAKKEGGEEEEEEEEEEDDEEEEEDEEEEDEEEEEEEEDEEEEERREQIPKKQIPDVNKKELYGIVSENFKSPHSDKKETENNMNEIINLLRKEEKDVGIFNDYFRDIIEDI